MAFTGILLIVALLLAIGVGMGLRRRVGVPLAIAAGGATMLGIFTVFALLFSRSNM